MEEINQELWRGKYTSIKKDEYGNNCHSMNGEKAILFVPINNAQKNSIYRFKIEIRSLNGNGILYFNLYASKEYDFSHMPLNCTTNFPTWQTFEIDVTTANLPVGMPCMFRIWRSPHGTGSLLVKSISFEKLPKGSSLRPEPKILLSERVPESISKTYTEQYEQKVMGPPSVAFPFSYFNKEDTKVLIVSEIEKETILCDAFKSNGISCESMVSDFKDLFSIVNNLKYNWIHIHIKKETKLTFEVLQKIRTIDSVIITIFIENGIKNFNEMLPTLQMANAVLLENEMDLTTFRNGGCFNAELWDPGTFKIISEKNENVILYTTETESELALFCKEKFPQLLITNDFNLLSTASVVIIDNVWPSRILFSLFAADVPVIAKKSFKICEWCQDNIDLQFFETMEECIFLINKTIENPISTESAKKISELHSPTMRVLELATRFGCPQTINSKLSNDRIYNLKKIMCIKKENITKFKKEDLEVITTSFTNYIDTVNRIIRFRPDMLYIYLEDNNIPWKYLLLDLRRRLPNMLVILGCLEDNVLIKDLSFSVDHIILNNDNIIEKYNKMSILNIWKIDLLNNFEISTIQNFVKKILEARNSFLALSERPIDLTIFIGTYNRLNQLKESVRSSLISAGKRTTQIIINDAGSTDGTQEWLQRSIISNIVPIFSGKRTSFSQAFNESLQIAKGKYICWLSDDIIPQNNALSDMCALMDDLNPTDMGGFSVRNSWGFGYSVRMDSGFHFPTVGCMYTETLKKMNGMNMDYPYYSQDTDLVMRIYKLGGHVVAANNCQLLHNCLNDELRITNGNKHKDNMGDAKFLLAGWNLSKTSSFPYPTILLIPKECSSENVKTAISKIKSQYLNCHIFIIGETSIKFNISETDLFLHKISQSCEKYSFFDLIIEVYTDKNVLIKPAEKANIPFVKNMLV